MEGVGEGLPGEVGGMTDAVSATAVVVCCGEGAAGAMAGEVWKVWGQTLSTSLLLLLTVGGDDR